MKATVSPVHPLCLLPRTKPALDFVLNKLSQHGSPDRFEILKEIFEMHRTSVGFNPYSLSKGRIKRFKSSELKAVLVQLEKEISEILLTDEYQLMIQSAERRNE